MAKIPTPCVGICSTTSFGDSVCRGCHRFAFEVINWNRYKEEEKSAVIDRLSVVAEAVIRPHLRILDTQAIELALVLRHIRYVETASPYLWLAQLIRDDSENMPDLTLAIQPVSPLFIEAGTWHAIMRQFNQIMLEHHEGYFERYFGPAMKCTRSTL